MDYTLVAKLTERQRLILGMALRYMKANLPDVNDTFQATEGPGLEYAGRRLSVVDERDVDSLIGAVGED